ncbi:MAG TPA: hypothetical protein VKH37_09025, partial [Ferruginibacter sp.]|nr:hypothetical protein [Ferruginibacter sp.]
GDWVKVKYNESEGYMRRHYLSEQKDFFETDAIIHTVGTTDTIRETRFKLSLLNYFRLHNYKPPFNQTTDYIKQTFLSDTSSYVGKEEWRISQLNSLTNKGFLRGKFTGSSKSGMAVIIEKSVDPSRKKLLIFNYDENETETSVAEFPGRFLSMYVVSKPSVWYMNGTMAPIPYNGIHVDELNSETIFVYDGSSMQAYLQPARY